MGVPYAISIWWLPERLYTGPYEKPRSQHFRRIDPEKWDEALDLLLGDAAGPRNTHTYVLAPAADAEAMQYAGAVAFYSWSGATTEQYAAWGDVGEWLGLPLLVAELGVDAAAYHTWTWDSYHYGLREARMTQEILLHARPQGTQFRQFTNDYSLARLRPDQTVEPTARFWVMKHFTDLTPQKSEAPTTASDQAQVLFTAFRAGPTGRRKAVDSASRTFVGDAERRKPGRRIIRHAQRIA